LQFKRALKKEYKTSENGTYGTRDCKDSGLQGVTLCLYVCRLPRFGGSCYPYFHAQAALG